MGSCPFLVVSNLLPLSSFSIFEVVSLNCEKNETAKVDTVQELENIALFSSQ